MLMPETLILNLSVVVGTVLPASLVFAGLLYTLEDQALVSTKDGASYSDGRRWS
ncbi:hypothetical protein BO86DRAFT_390112 [Aspergillus japonicus CBS 114.51]|uniref:Uncharacterized protein n=2 Tax=Aspergillus TaxID=5052 RepID=A0A2V5HZ60_ASPV1|nr:hypothetical protein BO86DRAFT_390112 [Aspergillus japonicus CBS 114.51]PYI21600.1 hypothetical protein BO99DRAFT_400897 [Aspergillus violaceofuscus CBS 115571]RAH80732.1 hypothetical protein BO86DRAFT_390112 [Aspergillus japonicus CBS 114.51]